MIETNTRKAFYAFLDWSEGKSFNEILGCAKSHIDNLTLIWDVDDYNFNEIGCRVRYWDVFTDTSCRVEIKILPNGQLNMVNLDDNISIYDVRHEKSLEELQKDICKLLNTTDEDEILTYWNDCVQNSNDFDEHRLYDFDIENLEEVFENYDSKEVAKMVFNLHNDGFDAHDKYFYITNDYKLQTCNSIWSMINLPMFYDYITEYIKIEKYGKIWDRSLYHEKEKEEILVCRMENGDEIWGNAEKKYLALYLADATKPVYLYINR
jgi:hypothetical protein